MGPNRNSHESLLSSRTIASWTGHRIHPKNIWTVHSWYTLPETNIAHENPIFPGKYHQNCGFSMAMLVSGSVHALIFRVPCLILEEKAETNTWDSMFLWRTMARTAMQSTTPFITAFRGLRAPRTMSKATFWPFKSLENPWRFALKP